MKKKHISREAFFSISAGFLLIIFLLSGGFVLYQRNVFQEKVNASISEILNQTSKTVYEKIERVESLARYFRGNATIIDVLKQQPDYQMLKTVDQIISDFGNSGIWEDEYITIVGENGHIFVNWENGGGLTYNDGIIALKERISAADDVLNIQQFERFTNYDNLDRFDKNKKMVGVVSAIYNNDDINDRIGIITVSIPERALLSTMEESNIYKDGIACIMDRKGVVLLSTVSEMRGTVVNLDAMKWKENSMAAGNSTFVYQGNRMMAFYQPIDSEWVQMVMIPYSTYVKEIRVMFLVFAGIFVLAAGLALLISTGISYRITKPIKELEHSMDMITKGELRGRVHTARMDELGMLGVHFNVMADNLENLIKEKVENQKRTSELMIANKTAELKMLHAQINPHFLFNTLNSIRCLAIINKEEYIAHMLESLGALLENSIMKGNEDTSIGREVILLKKYIELQQMRYGKRLRAEFLVDENIYDRKIPRFMLQPLIENAIMHGLSDKIGGGTIVIRGYCQDERVCLEIEDDGVGIDETKFWSEKDGLNIPASARHGIGLNNIRERLLLIYGNECGMDIGKGREGQGTLVRLLFPTQPYTEEHYD